MDSNDAVRFWTLPDGSLLEDANPPVTDAQLASFRQQYEFQLPDALVVLYRQQNGEPTVCYVDENGVRETGQTFEEWIFEALGNGQLPGGNNYLAWSRSGLFYGKRR